MTYLVLPARSSFNVRVSTGSIGSVVDILRMNHRVRWRSYCVQMRLGSSQRSDHWPFFGSVHHGEPSLIIVNVGISSSSVSGIMNNMSSLLISSSGNIRLSKFGLENISWLVLGGVLCVQ